MGEPESQKEEPTLSEDDKMLVEEYVKNYSKNRDIEGENSQDSKEQEKNLLGQSRKTIIKQLVAEFFEERGEKHYTENNKNLGVKKEICVKIESEENSSSGEDKSCVPLKNQEFENKENENNAPVSTEEREDSIKTITTHLIAETQNIKNGKRKTSEIALCEDFIVKSHDGETHDGSQKETSKVCLTPEEEQEIRSLILLAENRYCTETENELPIKSEVKDNVLSNCISVKDEKELFEKQSLKSGKDCLKDLTNKNEYYSGENIDLTAVDESRLTSLPVSLDCPVNDPRSKFYIDRNFISPDYYQERLMTIWTPTSVLHELCVQCNWSKPKFTMIDFGKAKGIMYSVEVNGLSLDASHKSNKRKIAKQLASVTFLTYLGFYFDYDFTRVPTIWRMYHLYWSVKYEDFNSISLQREEEKLNRLSNIGGKSLIEEEAPEVEQYVYCQYKRKRSPSNESRDLKRLSSLENKLRRELIERHKRNSNDHGHRSRRDVSPESHHSSYFGMDKEEPRRSRTVHERIRVTHDDDLTSSHSRRSSRDSQFMPLIQMWFNSHRFVEYS